MIAHVRKISSLCAVSVLFALPLMVMAKGGVAGTYSSIKYNGESGDLSGYEIQIIPVVNGYKAILQLAEGEVTDVVVSDATVDKEGVLSASFVLRSGGGCKLRAKVMAGKLVGVLSFEKSGDVDLTMPRSIGYWDSQISKVKR